jgi:hypothetical protein
MKEALKNHSRRPIKRNSKNDVRNFPQIFRIKGILIP